MKVVPDPGQPAFILSLHDVAPPSWPLYRDFIAWLDQLGGLHSSLLVVPDFHHQAPAAADTAFCDAMRRRQAGGDELVLHGYSHTDDAPLALRAGQIVRRRILTHEGEFAALDQAASTRRIEAGLALCRRQRWQVDGFVPPGWMSNPASRRAIHGAGFRYRTDGQALYRLQQQADWPTEQRLPLPTLVMSSRSAWRRALFAALNRRRWHRFRAAPVIRLAVHPVDLRHARSRRLWVEIIEQLHGERRSLTQRQWLHEAEAPPEAVS